MFLGAGFAFASWASRIPQVRDKLHLAPADLGLVLLALAAGSIVGLPLAGLVISRLGTRLTVASMAVLMGGALAVVAVGYLVGVLVVGLGLFVFGFAVGTWDVAMNVQGADVERLLGKAIMPRFHAGYSLGTVAGALVGTLMIVLGVPVQVHLVLVAVLLALVVPITARRFLPDPEHAKSTTGSRGLLDRWREPRTLFVGVFVLAFAFAEGAGNDWIGIALIDGYGASAEVGGLGFAMFLTAMTVARWFGPELLDRYGRVVVVRVLAATALAGLLLFVYSPSTPLAVLGAVLWGVGSSLGFPVGMSAAADEPAAAAGRVSVVSSIGYCAFLGGPPLIGFLGGHGGVLHALIAVAVLLAVAAGLATALVPPAGASSVRR